MRLIFLILLIAINATADTENKTLEIIYNQDSINHKYVLWENPKNSVYRLSIDGLEKNIKYKIISKSLAEQIKSEGRKIIWNSKFRRPSAESICNAYAIIVSEFDKATVCDVDHRSVGITLGFLNSLKKLF